MQNGPFHVLGQHYKCDKYFCEEKKNCGENWVPQAIESGMLMEINNAANRLVFNSKSLIIDVDNNICEQFNSVINKYIGGKRINLSQRNAYNTKVEAAVISFNSNQYLRAITKKVINKSPGIIKKNIFI